MEDVVLHYKPGPEQNLPALIESTEKVLRPFVCRPPQVFSPWFPSIVDRHLPLRPARSPPRILSALNQDFRGADGRPDRGLSETQEQTAANQRSPDRGVPFIPETPPELAVQKPGLKSPRSGGTVQEQRPQQHHSGVQILGVRNQELQLDSQSQEVGLQGQNPRLKRNNPGVSVQEASLKRRKPGAQIQEICLQTQKPGQNDEAGSEVQELGVKELVLDGKVQEPDQQIQDVRQRGQKSGLEALKSGPQVQKLRRTAQESGLEGYKPGLKSLNPGINVQEPRLNCNKSGPQIPEVGLVTQDTGSHAQELSGKVQELQDEEAYPEGREKVPQICSTAESPSKRCWTVFMHQVRSQSRTKASPRVQVWSRRFQQTVSKLQLQPRLRVKWIIDRNNRDIEQVWRCLSRPPPSLSLPSCCNAHIDRSVDQVWVYCDLAQSEQVGLSLKHGLKLRGRICLWERRLGHFYTL